jgi:peptide/nickel transport system ATP-binding protein
MPDNILEVRNLKKYFKTPRGMLHAVDGISFPSRAGKRWVSSGSPVREIDNRRCILRLIEPTDGEIIFDGADITKLPPRQLRRLRKDMQIIFQDPFSSLDPRRTVLQTITEPIAAHRLVRGKAAVENRVLELMETVGLAVRLINTYPHELDGGRRQRIGIARALAMEPKFIVCDEPVSALDVSIPAQILNLLKKLQRQVGLPYIFITHDLGVVNHFSDDIAVMYLGQLVEMAPAEELFSNPVHPYTKALLSAIPVPEIGGRRERILLRGEITNPIDPPDECRFLRRCTCAAERCAGPCPQLRQIGPEHFVACHLA